MIQMSKLYLILAFEIGVLVGMILIIPSFYISDKVRYDCNRDGSINMVDVVELTNYIKNN